MSTTGNDSNAGTAASPFATLQRGVSFLAPGDTLDVEPGTYAGFIVGWDSATIGPSGTGGDPCGVLAGTSAAPVTIQAAPGSAAGSVIINAKNSETDFGIDLEPGCNYITVSGFTIADTGGITTTTNHGGGFKLCGNNDAATNNTITSITLGFGIIADNANNVVIKNNSISGVGYQVLQSSGSTSPDADYGHGIYLSGSNSGAVIEGNTIFNNSYVGIHINGDASEGGTGVVTNALIEDNLIYNNGQNGINADGLQSSLIENNLIYGYGGFGVCLYQSDAGGPSIDNVLVNNTIVSTVSGAGAAVRILDGGTGNTIVNNILLGADGNTLRISSNSLSGLICNNNVVTGQYQSDDTGATETMAQWEAQTGQDKNSIVATSAQLFVNASANNYELSSTSPALDAGTTLDAPSTDLLGNPRSSGIDIGCYQI
ncbi:MAG: right-handed parallel beta-helix repeat-containing protein [Thermoguttaceae bacterium]